MTATELKNLLWEYVALCHAEELYLDFIKRLEWFEENLGIHLNGPVRAKFLDKVYKAIQGEEKIKSCLMRGFPEYGAVVFATWEGLDESPSDKPYKRNATEE